MNFGCIKKKWDITVGGRGGRVRVFGLKFREREKELKCVFLCCWTYL